MFLTDRMIDVACGSPQVSVILLLELTLLPALHGCWVDVCLLPLTSSTLADRTLWFQFSPVSFLVGHWLLGMAVLMATASFLSIVRQQLRPGATPPPLHPGPLPPSLFLRLSSDQGGRLALFAC
jgi:hypothetical protein